ncbi:MAG TPA: hypothetical protein VN736_07125 [Candidatus Limnocylindrales bacterium]|nr:hypothetical protein [Candidatus Limnocylindrales bacterium]
MKPARSVFAFAVISLVGACAAFSQIYPPGGYPPGGGGYPGGGYPTGGGIPLPGRKASPGKGSGTTAQPMPNFRGKLKAMDAKSIIIALDDDRSMEFQRTSKTKFFKNGDELKDPKFTQGDQVSVEGPEDDHGKMVAVNVYWEKGAAAVTAAAKNEEDPSKGVIDTWKGEVKDAPAKDTPLPPPSTAADPDDPGRPKLRRGGVADPAREHAPDLAATPPPPDRPLMSPPPPAPPSASGRGGDDLAHVAPAAGAPRVNGDDLIRKATDAALEFTESLPNYVCQEMMARYQSDSNPPHWQALDVVNMDLVYENHRESYKNITINGKKFTKKMEEMDGAWSTGEFGTMLIDLFSPATAADFHYVRVSRSGGVSARVYDFDVQHDNSHWDVHMGSQSYSPAYRGSVWIDPATARVLRIEMQAYGFPQSFPTDHVESATDYEYTRLGDAKQYLLPVHSETLNCQRGTPYCSRNVIDFRNYHKYEGESTVTFTDIKK